MKREAALKLLIVDDSKAMRDEFCGMCLEFLPGSRISEAEDAMRAMALLKKEHPPFDVVFTDINMPDITGLQLISHVREMPLYKKTPLIVISALSARNDIDKAIQLGADGYLTRPLRRDDFEVVYLTYLRPVLDKKPAGTALETDVLMDSLRKKLK